MPVLTRYYLKELLRVFFLTLGIITFFMLWVGVTFNLPEEMKSLRLAWVVPFLIPEAVRNALQAASLFAACSVFGRMSAQNELVALNSLGVSAGFLLLPVLLLGLVAGFAGVWLYEVGISWGSAGLQRTLVESIDSIAYEQLEKNHWFSTPQVVFRVQAVEGRKLLNATAVISSPDDGRTATIVARQCWLETNRAKQTLSVFFDDGTIEQGGHKLYFEDVIEQTFPLAPEASGPESWPPKNITLGQLREGIASKEQSIALLERELAADVIPIPPPSDEPAELLRPTPAELQDKLRSERTKLDWYKSQVYRRWANGFFSLAFVMVGVPVAVMLRSGDPLSAFFLCFLPVVLVNHPLHNLCIRLSESGRLPPWSPWIGNVVLMAVGVGLLQRLNRPGAHEFLKRFRFAFHRLGNRGEAATAARPT